jgi:NAD(P)H-flavin reductase
MVLTMTDDPTWEGDTRRIDAEFLRELLGGLDGFTYLVSGPPAMVNSVADSLEEAGVPEEQVRRSRFAGY